MKRIISLIIIGSLFYLSQHSVSAQEKEKIIFNKYAEKFDMKPVVFTHGLHIKRNKCEICHDAIFIKKNGANDINMAKNSKGQYCGKCHNGKDAYPLLKCERCHSGETTIKKK
ncbi:MAG: c(7)-type cytochrome triheme domain-containing protein [Nitrospirota bacterium]